MNCLQPLPSPVIIRQLSDLDFKSPSLIMTLVPQIFNDFLLYIHTHTHTHNLYKIHCDMAAMFLSLFSISPPIYSYIAARHSFSLPNTTWFFPPMLSVAFILFYFFLPGMFSLFLRLCLVDILGVIQVLCQKSPTQFSA